MAISNHKIDILGHFFELIQDFQNNDKHKGAHVNKIYGAPFCWENNFKGGACVNSQV